MKCPHCGVENPLHQQYCRSCGRKIDVDFAMIQESVALDEEHAKVRKPTRALIPVAAVLLAANVIVWAFGRQLSTRVRSESLPIPVAPPPELPVVPLEMPPLPPAPGGERAPLPLPEHVGAPSDRFSFRRGGVKEELHGSRGGSPEALEAVRRGLACLAAHQAKDSGRWSVTGTWERGAESWGNVAVTGLAVLALLGDGHVWTDTGGAGADPLAEAAGLGVRSLVASQEGSGRFGAAKRHHMYNQGIATAAVCEAYAMSGLALLRGPARKGVDYVVASQRPNGGWDYVAAPGTRADMSVTVWQVTALDAARRAGLDVPPEAFKRAESFVYMMTSSETARAQYATEPVGNRDPIFSELGPTAMALACKAMLGRPAHARDSIDQSRVLLANPPAWDAKWLQDGGRPLHVYSYWYHGTVGMRPMGEKSWEEWYAAAAERLVAIQGEDGSWPPAGRWAHAGGRVYATALALLTLEATYRYP